MHRLTVGDLTFRWWVSHTHGRGVRVPDRDVQDVCRQTLSIRREGAKGQLRVSFTEGPETAVAEGYFYAGCVGRVGEDLVNLNEPGVARAFLDEALARGWDPAVSGEVRVDGWGMFDAVLKHRDDSLPANRPARGAM